MQTYKSGWLTQVNILCIGQAVLMMMITMSLPYWPLYIEKIGHFSPTQIRYWSAAIYVAPLVSSIFASPFWGKIGDKHGYKPMVLRACLGLFITQGLLVVVSNVFGILIIRLIQGAFAGFIAAAQAWALDIGPVKAKGLILGKLQASIAFGNLLGPALGGFIAAFLSYKLMFGLSTVICLGIFFSFFFILQSTKSTEQIFISKNIKSREEKESNVSNLSPPTFTSLFKNSAHHIILSILFVIVITQIAQSMITPIFALFIVETLTGNEMIVGLLYSISGFMLFLSAPFVGKCIDKYKDNQIYISKLLIWFLCALGVLQILQAFSNTVLQVFVLRILRGICLGGVLPVLTALLIQNSQDNHKGVFLGFGNSANRFGTLIGTLLGSLIELKLGFSVSFLINASFYGISIILVIIYIHLLKQMFLAREFVENFNSKSQNTLTKGNL